jgi:hypothetical protein
MRLEAPYGSEPINRALYLVNDRRSKTLKPLVRIVARKLTAVKAMLLE